MIKVSQEKYNEGLKAIDELKNRVTAGFHNRILKEQDERYAERIEKLEVEIKELKGLLRESISNDGENATFDERVKQALNK